MAKNFISKLRTDNNFPFNCNDMFIPTLVPTCQMLRKCLYQSLKWRGTQANTSRIQFEPQEYAPRPNQI